MGFWGAGLFANDHCLDVRDGLIGELQRQIAEGVIAVKQANINARPERSDQLAHLIVCNVWTDSLVVRRGELRRRAHHAHQPAPAPAHRGGVGEGGTGPRRADLPVGRSVGPDTGQHVGRRPTRHHGGGRYPSGASPDVAPDQAGNVWEWSSGPCKPCPCKPCPYTPRDWGEDQDVTGSRVLSGGAWSNSLAGRACGRPHRRRSDAKRRARLPPRPRGPWLRLVAEYGMLDAADESVCAFSEQAGDNRAALVWLTTASAWSLPGHMRRRAAWSAGLHTRWGRRHGFPPR